MSQKRYAIFVVALLLFAFVISPASAACSKSKSGSTGTCTAGACNSCASGGTNCANCEKYGTCATCAKDNTCGNKLCITYMKCTGTEYIKICNGKSSAVNLKGYKLVYKCNSCTTKTYTFPSKVLKPGQCVYVYSCNGANRGNLLYARICGDLVKCNGMTVELRASCGKVVSKKTN